MANTEMTPERKEKLSEIQDKCRLLIDNLQKVIDGEATQMEIATILGTNGNELSRQIRQGFPKITDVSKQLSQQEFEEILKANQSPYEKLLQDLLGDRGIVIYVEPEHEDKFQVLMEKRLSSREHSVINYRYGFDEMPILSLEKIGEKLGVHREAVRRIQVMALRKLRHPSCLDNLVQGYLSSQTPFTKTEYFDRGMKKYEKLIHARFDEGITTVMRKYRTTMEQARFTSLTLADAGFSIRTYNCLNRAGIKYLKDLLLLSPDELLSIRYLGDRSIKEIEDKLAQYNVTLRNKTITLRNTEKKYW